MTNNYLDKTLVFIDFETTGFSPKKGDRITEVCLVKIINGKEIARFSTLVNCGVKILEKITELTGITQEMVDSAPPVAEVIPKVLEFIGDSILGGQNVAFDEAFLVNEANLLGLVPRYFETICTKELAKKKCRNLLSYKLKDLAEHFKLERKGDAHRAESDVDLTVKLFYRLLDLN